MRRVAGFRWGRGWRSSWPYLTLGWLADSYDLSRAFAVVMLLDVAALLIVALFGRIEGKTRD